MKHSIRRTARSGIYATLLGLLVTACGGDTQAETETHFLTVCDRSCGEGLTCICGVCSEECARDSACVKFAGAATCAATPDACDSDVASACDMECADSGDCRALGTSYGCVSGRCRPASDGDGGTGAGDGGMRDGGGGSSGASGSSAGSGGTSAGTGGTAGASGDPARDCDCALELYVPVCGTDGETHDATCGRQCVDVAIACDGECPCAETDAGTRELRWYETCGDPVCAADPEPWDDPAVPNCTNDEQIGSSCDQEGALCDGAAICGASVLCAASDPKVQAGGCPISRSRFKEDIAYLSEQQLHDYAAQLLNMPLASYRYKHDSGAGPQLGFIIEDIEPSVAVNGDRVNMYGYLSMAVAAIQVQRDQIASLQLEMERLRAQLPGEADPVCLP